MKRFLMILAATTLLALGSPAAAHAAFVLLLPIPGPVVRPFDPPAQRWLAGHRGVDLAGRVGQPVRSAAAGVVTFAGELAGREVMVVRHGELRTTYEPVHPALAVGTRVAAGQVIGELRDGHRCPAPVCLHWGLRRGDTYLNPLAFLPGEVVLLPGGVARAGQLAAATPGGVARAGQLAAATPGGVAPGRLVRRADVPV